MRYLDAGESHGKMLVAIVEGMPSNVLIDKSHIDYELSKRQQGFGRGQRMGIEKDAVEIVSGVRGGKSTGAPITLLIHNKDYDNWKNIIDDAESEKILRPRPGHADLNGVIKYNLDDIRDVIERSSARETAIRTAVGALSSLILREFGITAVSRVIQIGKTKDDSDAIIPGIKYAEESAVMCSDREAEEKMIDEIKDAAKKGDTLGGRFEVIIKDVPIGLGSYAHWDRRLDSRLAGAVMGIQGIKAVEVGNAAKGSELEGSMFHDEIYYSGNRGYYRISNNSGGIEGGISNGEEIVIRGTMKPIPTLKVPLNSVNINTKASEKAVFERSDVCAVPAASIVARNVCMWEICCAFLDKFGGDSMEEVGANYRNYMDYLSAR